MEVIQLVLVERIKHRVAVQMVNISVLRVMEEIVAVVQEVVKLVPQERVQQWTVEQVPVPRIPEETVKFVRPVPRERVQWIDEQMVEVLVPQRSGGGEQIVDALVSQDDVLSPLRFQVLAISNEIQKRSDVDSAKEEFLTEAHELAKQWGVLHED